MNSRPCLVCGRPIALVVRSGCGGPQTGFCSIECRKEAKKKASRKWALANRHKEAANRQALREKHPDYYKRFYANNRAKRKQEANDWYHANADRAYEHRKLYVEANRDMARCWGRKSANKRRAIKKRVFVEVVDPRTVFERDRGICGICRTRVEPNSKWEIDHMIPISKGGAHAYANVQLAHRKCNRSKSAKLPSGQPTLFQVAV